MANQVFNIAKGHVNEYVNRVINNDPTNAGLYIVFLKVAEADATLIDYDSLSLLLAGSNTEADFTNYSLTNRPEITDSAFNPAIAVDDSNDRKEADFDDITITNAGGATNNTLVKAIVCYIPDIVTPGADSTAIPLTHHDFAVTTNGNDLIIQVDANGFYRAA
jgi:hypothetical protein